MCNFAFFIHLMDIRPQEKPMCFMPGLYYYHFLGVGYPLIVLKSKLAHVFQ